jgi:DNA-directed RNA polymerase specialized sigma24 family protein
VVQLYYAERLTLGEVAAVLELDVGHVGALVRSAIEKAERVLRPRAAK